MSGEKTSVSHDRTAHKPVRKCAVHSCNKKYYAKGYCHMHYVRIWRNGHLDIMPSGKASPNYGQNRAAAMDVA